MTDGTDAGFAPQDMLVATWFVSDAPEEDTFFPQIGMTSSGAGAKTIYWRCIAGFYATSLVHNPDAPHAFFTNTALPTVDGIDIGALLARWGVEVIDLPITYRLPTGRVGAWGNQFYIFDVIDHLARVRRWPVAVILDSDVVWTQPATEIARAVAAAGVATYVGELGDYGDDDPINGVTRAALGRFATTHDTSPHPPITYCGGEIFAATLAETVRIAARVPPLWAAILAGEADAPKEEAHLLSVVYAMLGVPIANADGFIKRMWTTFHHNTITRADLDLPLWHLPAEKRTGFRALFDHMRARGLATAASPVALGLDRALLGRLFGVPRRSLPKLVHDLSAKIGERLGLATK